MRRSKSEEVKDATSPLHHFTSSLPPHLLQQVVIAMLDGSTQYEPGDAVACVPTKDNTTVTFNMQAAYDDMQNPEVSRGPRQLCVTLV